LVFLLAASLLAAGCAQNIQGWSKESYRSEGFDKGFIVQKGLALLPTLIMEDPSGNGAGRDDLKPSAPYSDSDAAENTVKKKGKKSTKAYQVILSEILLSKLQQRWPALKLIPPGDVLVRLNDAGLTNVYQKFSRDSTGAGFTSRLLGRIGSALNIRYMLVSRAVVSESESEASVIIVWTFGRKSMLRSVKISAQIWDTHTGEQVWEGSGVGYHMLTAYEDAPLVEEMAEEAVERLMDNFRLE